MNAERLERATQIVADIVAFDKDGQVVLLVEVNTFDFKLKDSSAVHRGISQIVSYLKAAKQVIPFAMLVDLENIQIFQWDGTNLSEPIKFLKTASILSHYDPEFSNKRIFSFYLSTLVEAWLRDLAYHWKSEKPPASEELAAIDLLQRLEGGTTQTEVALSCDSLH
jgi:hypothetical protein